MTDFNDALAEDRRLVILRLLESLPDYSCNDSIIQTALDSFGHARTRDQVHVDLEWLKGVDLLTTRVVGDGRIWVATLTSQGVDVATGRARCPGVKRPSPRAR